MGEQVYQLIITGKLLEGHSYDEVESALCRLLKLPVEKVRYLLRGERSRIKKTLPLEKAERLQKKIEQRGAECQIEEVSSSGADSAGDVQEKLDLQVVRESESPTAASEVGSPGVDDLDLDLPDSGPTFAEEMAADLSSAKEKKSKAEGDEIVLATPEPVEKHTWTKKVEDDGSKAQFYDAPVAKKPEPNKKAAASKTQLQLGILLGVLIVGGGAWGLLNMEGSDPEPIVEAPKPAVPINPQQASTMDGLTEVARYVKVWMIQFGSGFDPTQVTLQRLQQDLDVPAKYFKDEWGQAIQYEALDRSYRLSSSGPDKAFGTQDDIHKEVELQR